MTWLINDAVSNDIRCREKNTIEMILQSAYRLEHAIGSILPTPSSTFETFSGQKRKVFYSNVPLCYTKFITALTQTKLVCDFLNPEPLKYPVFLDAGCGLGIKMFFAKKLGWDAHGIDINSEYIKIANKILEDICGKSQAKLHDIMTYEQYNKFDCVYYYTPISEPNSMRKFAEKVYKDMKRPSVLIQTFNQGTTMPDDCCVINNNVYLLANKKDRKSVQEYLLSVNQTS